MDLCCFTGLGECLKKCIATLLVNHKLKKKTDSNRLIVDNSFFKAFLVGCKGHPGTDFRKEFINEKGEKEFWASA